MILTENAKLQSAYPNVMAIDCILIVEMWMLENKISSFRIHYLDLEKMWNHATYRRPFNRVGEYHRSFKTAPQIVALVY